MLKMTGIELEFLSDYDMILMIKNGIRGGVSTITTRRGKSNNKYMGETFDKNELSKYITYLDANNLYGWAMSKPLPTDGFAWMTEDELNKWKDTSREADAVPQSTEDIAAYLKTLSMEELRSKAQQLEMSGYDELSEVGLRMFIEDVIECHNVDVSTTKHNDYGFILEVDLEYPEELHDAHNEYPLASESVGKLERYIKLIPNLNNKTK